MFNQQEVLNRIFIPGTSDPSSKDQTSIVQFTKSGERTWTNQEVERLIAGSISELKRLGVQKGDKVVLCSENCAELSSMMVACWALQALAVAVDFRLPLEGMESAVKSVEPKLVVLSKNLFYDFDKQSKAVADKTKILELTTMARYKDVEPESQFDVSSLDLDAPAFLILTSGTTGKPKAALHDLRSFLNSIIDLAELASGIDGTMTALFPLPISHIFGMEVFFVCNAFGLKIVFTELDPRNFIMGVRKHRPHLIASVPPFYGAMLAAPEGALDLSNTVLLLSGGAPLSIPMAEKFEKRFGKRLNNGYGSTESKIVAINLDGPLDSVGKIASSAKIEIVNDQDEVLPEGAKGEVRIAGPMLMNGYVGMDEASKKVLHNGHYHTGDIGYFKDGHLFVSGRMKEMLVVGGSTVFPGEIEDVLRMNETVREVAVIGLPDDKFGEKVKAIVVLNDHDLADKLTGSPDDRAYAQKRLLERFQDYCQQNMRKEMVPSEWDFRGPKDTLPKNLAGKIDKQSLQAS